ncbi:centrosomal protein of 128 kDa-like [Daphnia pulicaria]|uniref:centrosomal protein of 128 kDa-like n=1 Tax=Daphnia pulicaria TaxID=35523 RepID=UPI001EEA6B6A|nr:centrosomal protein of 128 kDa-like [Daphnia pulicaria]
MVFKDFLTTVKSTVSSLLLEPVPTNQTEQQPDTNIFESSLNPYQYPMELKRTPVKERDVHFDDFSSTRLPSSGLIPLSNKRKFIPTSSGVVPGNVPSNNAIYLKNGPYKTIKAEPNYQTVFTIPIKPEEQGSSSKVCFEYDFNSIKELKVSNLPTNRESTDGPKMITEFKTKIFPERCHNQVPTTNNMQEATDRTRIVTQPTMWKSKRASSLLPDSTESMVKNTEITTVDDLPEITKIAQEYLLDLKNDNQNHKNEIGVCQNVSARLHGVEEMAQEVESMKETLDECKLDSRKCQLPNPEKPDDYDECLKQLRYENSHLKNDLEMKAALLDSQAEHIHELLTTENQMHKKYRNMSEMKTELTTRNAELERDKSLLELKNADLKKNLMRMERKNRKNQDLWDTRENVLQSVQKAEKLTNDQVETQPEAQSQEKLLDLEQQKQLVYDNSNLKTELETSARKLSLQSEEIKNLTARTNELTNRLEETSLKNDELIRELVISRNMASAITDGFHQIESKLKKEINDLKDQLNSKQKILEEKDVILESTLQDKKVAAQKDEEMHQSQLELQLAHQKNLNDQLENQLTELKRTMKQITAERGKFRFLYEDATELSAEQARKLAEQTRQQAADNGLLLSEKTQLEKELAASLSEIDELKKEKSVLLCNASTATESRLRNEIVNLKSKIEDQNETLSSNTSELERIKLDDSFLYISLESTKAMLAKKETENEDLNIRNSDLKSEKSLLEVYNKNLKKEAEDSWRKLERMERENRDLLNARDEVLQSAQKAEKLAKDQVEALSEALAALQEALECTLDAAAATKAERKSMNSGATKTEGEIPKKRNWIKKLIAKSKSSKSRQNEDGYADFLETTGQKMVQRAKSLQEHANNIKAEGKALKKKAKLIQK